MSMRGKKHTRDTKEMIRNSKSVFKKENREKDIERVKKLIVKHKGFITHIAEDPELGCAYSTLKEFIDSEPELQKWMRHHKEKVIDRAESTLFDKLEDSDRLLEFFLKTQGRERGYSQKVEINIVKYEVLEQLKEVCDKLEYTVESVLKGLIGNLIQMVPDEHDDI